MHYAASRETEKGADSMRIGDVAIKLEVSRDTIRRLERRGLVCPKRDWNGHRRYSNKDVERIRAFLFQVKQPQKEGSKEKPSLNDE